MPDSKTPALIALVMAIAGIAIAATGGLLHGSIPGGVIAAAGAIRTALARLAVPSAD